MEKSPNFVPKRTWLRFRKVVEELLIENEYGYLDDYEIEISGSSKYGSRTSIEIVFKHFSVKSDDLNSILEIDEVDGVTVQDDGLRVWVVPKEEEVE